MEMPGPPLFQDFLYSPFEQMSRGRAGVGPLRPRPQVTGEAPFPFPRTRTRCRRPRPLGRLDKA